MATAGLYVQDIINEALGHLGVYSGDPLSASDLQSAYFTFSGMVDGWALEPGTFRSVSVLQFVTTAGKSSYNVGPAGTGIDWVTPFLPLAIDDGDVQMMTGTLEIPLAVDSLARWQSIGIKSLAGSILSDVYPDFGASSVTLTFFPVPSAAIPINLYLRQQIARPTATTNQLVLSPGYQEALTFELAIKLTSKFGATLPEWLPEAWRESKSRLSASNWEALELRVDAALQSHGTNTGGGSIAFYLGL